MTTADSAASILTTLLLTRGEPTTTDWKIKKKPQNNRGHCLKNRFRIRNNKDRCLLLQRPLTIKPSNNNNMKIKTTKAPRRGQTGKVVNFAQEKNLRIR